jgi:hypothetical protein
MDFKSSTAGQMIGYRQRSEEFGGLTDVSGLFRLICLIVLVAIASSVLPVVFLFTHQLRFFILFSLGQGVVLGIGLQKIFRAVKLRKKTFAFATALVTSLLGILLIHAGFYFVSVLTTFESASRRFGKPIGAFPLFQSRPYLLYNMAVKLSVGQGGFGGYLAYRLGNHTYSSMLFVHAVFTSILAWQICKSQLAGAFCESCGRWMSKPRNSAVVPTGLGEMLVEAVQSGEPDKALAITRAAADLPLNYACVVARSYRCGSCGGQMVDVIRKQYARRAAKVFVMLKPVDASPEFVDALQSDPVVVADESSAATVNTQDESPDADP